MTVHTALLRELSTAVDDAVAGGGSDARLGADARRVAEGAAAFAGAVASATPTEFTPRAVDAVRRLGALSEARLPVATTIVGLVDDLPWSPTMRATDGGTELALGLLNETADLGEVDIGSGDGTGVVAGLMFVDTHRRYPEHHHGPQELYLVIAGTGHWRYGGAQDYVELRPGDLLYNHPNDVHGLIAGDDPVLALYVLWP